MNFSQLKTRISGTPLDALLPFVEDEFLSSIKYGDHQRWRNLVQNLPKLEAQTLDFADTITIGNAQECGARMQKDLEQQLRELIPWRKGPFDLFGIEIDSEWRSDLKWARLAPHIAPLAGKTVLDVGSGNGYSSLRMCGAGAELVIGLEPHIPYYGQFCAVKHFTPQTPAFVLPITMEQMPQSLPEFDTVFSMGVIYHRRSPLDHLLQLANCLKPGGQLVMDSIVVDGEEGYSLMPDERYARMKNVWFLPSVPTLCKWLERCEFKNVRVIDHSITDEKEQRSTDWMPFESLQHSLRDNDKSKTVEGYPAPQRAIVLCEKA